MWALLPPKPPKATHLVVNRPVSVLVHNPEERLCKLHRVADGNEGSDDRLEAGQVDLSRRAVVEELLVPVAQTKAIRVSPKDSSIQ